MLPYDLAPTLAPRLSTNVLHFPVLPKLPEVFSRMFWKFPWTSINKLHLDVVRKKEKTNEEKSSFTKGGLAPRPKKTRAILSYR